MEIKFTIYGNQEDSTGNPVPYTRVVGRALWVPGALKYAAWKDYVRKCYFEEYQLYGMPVLIDDKIDLKNMALAGKYKPQPIRLTRQKARMDLKIYFKNGHHADPDNIFKGIADALFRDDKDLDGSFCSEISASGEGRVEISIKIED